MEGKLLRVAVFGAGPSGFYAVEDLLKQMPRTVKVLRSICLIVCQPHMDWCAAVSRQTIKKSKPSSDNMTRPPIVQDFVSLGM